MTQQLCLFDDMILGGPLEQPQPRKEQLCAHFGWGARRWFSTREDLETHLRQEFGSIERVSDPNSQYDYAYNAAREGGVVARVKEGPRPR